MPVNEVRSTDLVTVTVDDAPSRAVEGERAAASALVVDVPERPPMSSSTETRRIVVGYDGSDAAKAAVDWALDEAGRRHTAVVAVIASGAATGPTPGPPMMTEWPDEAADAVLKELRTHATARSPGVTLQTVISMSGAPGALLDGSITSELVVIGAEVHPILDELLLGATAPYVAAHAHCPVVVVPVGQAPAADSPVVVGVDGSLAAQSALELAFGHAAATNRRLVAVHAWRLDATHRLGLSTLRSEAVDRLENGHRTLAEEAVSTWSARFPDVIVEHVVVQGNAVDALMLEAKEAGLLVVGSRGHGGFVGLLMGSMSQGLLHSRLPCPLVVTHTADRASGS